MELRCGASIIFWEALGIDAVEIGFVVSALCLQIAALGIEEGAQI